MPVQRPWGRTVPCVPGGAVRRPVWSRVRRGREREEGRTERGRGRSCAESCGWWGRLGFLPPGRWGGGLWAEEGRALTRCLWSFLLFLLGCSLFAALQQPCGEGEGLTLGFPPPLSCHLWEPLAGESLGDALVLFPSCLANTVMAPRKQPRGHQAQWLDPPSSQLSAQSHQLGLYPTPTSTQLGSLSQGQTQHSNGAWLSACLPIHLLHRQPAGLGSYPVSATSQLYSLRQRMPFSGSHPGLTQAHQAQISLLGYPSVQLVTCLGLYLGPFSRDVLSGE